MTPIPDTARPISMSGPLVVATLEGRKTQTRRPLKGAPDDATGWAFVEFSTNPKRHRAWLARADDFETDARLWGRPVRCPYGTPGDRLWVRETVTVDGQGTVEGQPSLIVYYNADGARAVVPLPARIKQPRTGHKMPNGAYKEAARLWLDVVAVRIERPRDISAADARAEGFADVTAFREAWVSFYGAATLDEWAWVIEYRVVTP